MFIKKFENFDQNNVDFVVDLMYLDLQEYGLVEVPKDYSTTSLSLDLYWSDHSLDESNGYYCISKTGYSDDIDISMIVSERVNDDVFEYLKSLSNRLEKLGYKYTKFKHAKAHIGYSRYYIDLSKI